MLTEVAQAPAVASNLRQEEPKAPQFPGITETADHVSYLGVTLPKGRGGALTPARQRFVKDVITEHDLRLMQQIAVAWDLNQPVLIEGGSGFGKSQTVERMCAQLNRECYYANCHDFDADVLIGSKTVKEGTQTGFGWVDGIVLQAIRKGGVLFLDEYNFMKGETRGRLHEILDSVLRGKGEIVLTENNGEIVQVHPDFRLVAAQNPPGGKYGDREVLDPAQLTRFVYIKLETELPHELRLARALGVLGQAAAPDIPETEFFSHNQIFSRERLKEIPGIADIVRCYEEFTVAIERMADERELGEDQVQPVYFSFQRDFNRVLEFTARYFNGDLNDTFQRALRYYYRNKFEAPGDRAKVDELIVHVRCTPETSSSRIPLEAEAKKSAETQSAFDQAFAEKGFKHLLKLRDKGLSPAEISGALGGSNSSEAWQLRKEALDQVHELPSCGMAGLESEEAWDLRRQLLGECVHRQPSLCASLMGLDSSEAWQMRRQLLDTGTALEAIVRSACALNSADAWELRRKGLAADTEKYRNAVAESLAGLDTEEAWAMRNQVWSEGVEYSAYALSLVGLDSDKAWEKRGDLADMNNHTIDAAARSLAGLDSPRAWEMRRRLQGKGASAAALAQSLAGLDSPSAWEMRRELERKLLENSEDRSALAYSVFGDDVYTAVRAARRSL